MPSRIARNRLQKTIWPRGYILSITVSTETIFLPSEILTSLGGGKLGLLSLTSITRKQSSLIWVWVWDSWSIPLSTLNFHHRGPWLRWSPGVNSHDSQTVFVLNLSVQLRVRLQDSARLNGEGGVQVPTHDTVCDMGIFPRVPVHRRDLQTNMIQVKKMWIYHWNSFRMIEVIIIPVKCVIF